MDTTSTPENQRIIAEHDRFLINTYSRFPLAFVRGEGCELFDADGKRYLDLFAGFGAPILGHCHPDLIQAVIEQAQTLWHAGNQYYTVLQNEVAQAISQHGFGGLTFFSHSGADANEGAIKLARIYGRTGPTEDEPRYGVITAQQSFHGRSFATMAATGQPAVRKGFEPQVDGFVQVPFNDLAAIEHAISPQTVAVMVEPIQGEGGVIVPNDEYLPGLRQLCDRYGLLLIFDEAWTGCGRTGRYFAHQHWGVEPDIMTLAKGLGGGLAVGAMTAKPEIASYFDARRHGRSVHASTLGANCVAMAVSSALFGVLERDGLVDQANELGTHVIDRLRSFGERWGCIRDVRGKGLFIGIELDADDKRAWFGGGAEVVQRCMDRGILINVTQSNVLRLAPPLVIQRSQLDEGLNGLEQVIRGD